jgi:hypothetical protein
MAADVRIDAEASFKESILHNPHNVKAMLGLALIHRYRAVLWCGVTSFPTSYAPLFLIGDLIKPSHPPSGPNLSPLIPPLRLPSHTDKLVNSTPASSSASALSQLTAATNKQQSCSQRCSLWPLSRISRPQYGHFNSCYGIIRIITGVRRVVRCGVSCYGVGWVERGFRLA